MSTRSAPTRLIPRPPTRVVNINKNTSLLLLKELIREPRAVTGVDLHKLGQSPNVLAVDSRYSNSKKK